MKTRMGAPFRLVLGCRSVPQGSQAAFGVLLLSAVRSQPLRAHSSSREPASGRGRRSETAGQLPVAMKARLHFRLLTTVVVAARRLTASRHPELARACFRKF
ncbi:MAG: hypothetical protein HC801_13315 [Nitrospira sp.]|nr:hypothetical protein [Nitrospira sp.]